MGLLERIQSKDRSAKSTIAIGISGGITALIALVWVTTLPAQMANTISLGGEEEKKINNEKEERGLDSFMSDAKSQLGNIIQSNSLDTQGAESEVTTDVNADTALGGLTHDSSVSADASVPAPTPTPADPILTDVQEISDVPDSPSVDSVTPDVTQTTTTPQITPAPRVILIGTSTSQKSE
jgi:hypothetical protein